MPAVILTAETLMKCFSPEPASLKSRRNNLLSGRETLNEEISQLDRPLNFRSPVKVQASVIVRPSL